MHHFVTHNRDYPTFREFRTALLKFLRRTIPQKWAFFRDRITDNFRVMSRQDILLIAQGQYSRELRSVNAQERDRRST